MVKNDSGATKQAMSFELEDGHTDDHYSQERNSSDPGNVNERCETSWRFV